jgi:hypothetical protein
VEWWILQFELEYKEPLKIFGSKEDTVSEPFRIDVFIVICVFEKCDLISVRSPNLDLF